MSLKLSFALVIYALFSADGAVIEKKLRFPLQLSAQIQITAHLIPADQSYPPRLRSLHINYDYLNKRARADIAGGYEAEKTYIRRYDLEKEYMIRPTPIDDCKRSYLGETMPYPDLQSAVYLNEESLDGEQALHYVFEDFETLVHIYISKFDNRPLRLTQGSLHDGVFTPLLTYDYSDVVLGEPDEDLFDIPSPYSHESCDFHTGGFPYLHIFHYFVRF